MPIRDVLSLSSYATGSRFFRRTLNILTYHAVVAEEPPLPDWCFLSLERFEEQMGWLASQAVEVMPLEEALDALLSDRPGRPIYVLTFDDGYRNNVEIALPVLRRHGFPATIFLATGLVGSDRALWPNRIMLALARTGAQELSWAGEQFDLRSDPGRRAASVRLQELTKSCLGDNPAAAAEEIEALLDVPTDPSVERDSPYAMLDAHDIRTALDSGLISFGAHTVSHPLLSALNDDRLASEIHGSIDAVQDLTGEPCRTFAYPNGRPADFDERAVRLLAERGVSAGVTTSQGPNRRDCDPLRLFRWDIGAALSLTRYTATMRNFHPAAWSARFR